MKDTQLAQITLTDDSTGAIANPIHLSTAYKHPKLGQSTGFDYTRTKNPTRSTFENLFCQTRTWYCIIRYIKWNVSHSINM